MRLDLALVERGLARSRNHAARMIANGAVTVSGRPATKAAQQVDPSDEIEVQAEPWVSRAAYKLLGALEESQTPVPERVLDAGASTGGFTQVLLEQGAKRVYAVDVGHDQLVPQLRSDSRVVARDGLNLRDLTLADVEGQPLELIVGDLSFISLRLVLPSIAGVLSPGGAALLLVKPQFEVGRQRLGAGGVVRSQADRSAAVAGVLERAAELGLACDWQGKSALPGSFGNVEYFVRLRGSLGWGA